MLSMDFKSVTGEELDWADPADLDNLPYGVIGLGPSGNVEIYSATESRLAGLSRDRVIGRHFFVSVAPCMNNFLVAQRFEDEPYINDTLDYVLTLRMRPTQVVLRLLKSPGLNRRYLLVDRGPDGKAA